MVIALKVCRCSPIKGGGIAMEFYLKQNKIKLSVEYLFIIIYKNRVIVFLAVFLSQPRDSSKKKGKQVVLHFDLQFCVPTLTTRNVNVRVLGRALFLAYMVWGYSFLFVNTYLRSRKWSKIQKYLSQNRKIYGIKILNKKEKRKSC